MSHGCPRVRPARPLQAMVLPKSRFGAFAFVGLLATALHYIVLVGLVDGLAVAAPAASAAGYALSTLFNYAMNRRFTFNSRRRHAQALPRFLVVSGIGLALNTAVVGLMTAVAHWHYLLSQVLATALVLVWNFQLNRRWTFPADKSHRDDE